MKQMKKFMEKIIYKFLDSSVGPGVRFVNKDGFYNVYSESRNIIFHFTMRDDWEFVKIFRHQPLCCKISSLFSISEDEAAKHISDWFGERNGLKKVGDLKKFVPQVS